jgi:hypothetical protein
MGLGGLAWAQKKTGKEEKKARGASCYLLRWCWANNPLALPSKHPIPADLSITDPTCLCIIAGRDGAPLGERHEALARR